MNQSTAMTQQESEVMIRELSKVFDVVRLLDEETLETGNIKDVTDAEGFPCKCYSFWKKGDNCKNCTSRDAFRKKNEQLKLEYLDSNIYQVISKYVEIDGKPYVMELINQMNADAVMDEDGRNELIKQLSGYNRELYTDALTGIYNRRYYEERIRNSNMSAGVAMIDLDDFKIYNDTFGHDAGDLALTTVVGIIKDNVRRTDMLIRMGGDEFLLVMPDIGEQAFADKLNQIQGKIHSSKVPGYSQLRLSVSIGGVLSGSGSTVEKAIRKADQFMYQAKTCKNMVVTEHDEQLKEQQESANNNGSKAYKYRILVVDDSEMNREILSEILNEEYDIIEADSGDTCIDMLRKYETGISLVLLDIVMPGMDGFGVLNYMNHHHYLEDIPVIMISSEDSTETVRRAYEMGVSDYINRPFDAGVVHRRVYNTIKLYAKQRRLIALITNQVYEKEKNNRMMVGILSQIVEFRNGESGSHVLNINIFTGMLLESLVQHTDKYDLSWSERLLITTASALHDIGKIGIDDKILNKPGRLTDEEFKIMQNHTIIGASILENMGSYQDEELMKVAYQICRWHHERYDGKGYPDGLKGDEIPISAQVVSLADVYDALVSERVYKKAYSHEKAIEMITNGECGCFNPILLECLLDIQDRIKRKMKTGIPEDNPFKKREKKAELKEFENVKEDFMDVVSKNMEKEYSNFENDEFVDFSRGGAKPRF
ncbi:diguanylate cyclase [Blautia obeum]|uniref:Stage 0 sporulation protein A homolog n=1 Tax=Blautia obeum A2-162 TaxID=657314 RepID=D4LYS1_9FIRM|nr:diguanylate cyclase [Blautia obeum]RHA47509.1 diguanylate cyclase [Blautia obeum]CBL22774.1 diguanylate cyclase (GGDEF) domain [Blautia obeum A2-162]